MLGLFRMTTRKLQTWNFPLQDLRHCCHCCPQTRSKSHVAPHSPTMSSRKPFVRAWVQPSSCPQQMHPANFDTLRLTRLRTTLTPYCAYQKSKHTKNQKIQLPLDLPPTVETRREGHGTFSSTTRLLLVVVVVFLMGAAAAHTTHQHHHSSAFALAAGALKWNRTRLKTHGCLHFRADFSLANFTFPAQISFCTRRNRLRERFSHIFTTGAPLFTAENRSNCTRIRFF